MAHIFTCGIYAPLKVHPNVKFSIRWKDFFFILPGITYNVDSTLTNLNTGEEVTYLYNIRRWWFWGSRKHIYTDYDGISEDTVYKIDVEIK